MQFDFFKHILDVAPGFIGFSVYKFANGDEEAEQWDKAIMPFFMFAASSWLVSYAIKLAMLSCGKVLNETEFTVLSMLSAVVIGLCHSLFLQKMLLAGINLIREKMGLNHVNYAAGILQVFDDGKDHYVSIHRNNEKIASGWFSRMRVKEGSLLLVRSPEWEERLEHSSNILRTIVYLDKDTYIIEYKYDESLGSNTQKQ